MSAPWLRPLWKQFLQEAKQQRLAHAHCIPWRPEAATDTFIATLCQYLLCLQPGSAACGSCKSCALFKAGNHPDMTSLGDLEQNSIGVDEVRLLTAKLSNTANQGGRKVALIRQADKMTPAAANALLKTLEEPTADTFIILAPTRPQQLLPTIRSRVQLHKVPTLPVAELQQWLQQQTQQPVADDAIELTGYPEAPLTALAALQRRLAGDASKPLPEQILWQALSQNTGWPGLNDKDGIADWLLGSERLVQELIRVRQQLPAIRLHAEQDAIRQWFHQQGTSVAVLSGWLHDIISLKAQLNQSGLNAKLMLRDIWLSWLITDGK